MKGVYIHWRDAAIFRGDVSEVDINGLVDLESLGIIVKEDDEFVAVALEREFFRKNEYRCVILIPKINIIKRINFSLKSDE